MTSRKKSGFIAGVGVGAAAAAALRKRWSRSPEPADVTDTGFHAPSDDASRAFLEHLAEAVRFPTVSDASGVDSEVFGGFRRFLETTYPLVHSSLDLRTFSEHTLLFTWKGSDPSSKPFLLMAHQDVVPVEPGTESAWDHEPFSGEMASGYLWGRGSLDDKASLIGILEAVEGLLREGFTPAPTIYLLFGHDEEVGGGRGAALAADHLGEQGVRLAFVVDEGGAVVDGLFPGVARLALLGVGEKASLDVEIVAEGEGGHSSMPPRHTAIGVLAAAVKAIEDHPMPARMDMQRPLFEALGSAMRGPRGLLMRNLDFTGKLVERRLAAEPYTNALIRTTAAATVIRGGVKSNVLPQEATAIVNFRVLPGDSAAEVLDHVRSVVGDQVRVRAVDFGSSSDPAPVSSTDGAGFRIVQDVIAETYPAATIAPWILSGATDSRYFAPISDGVYRFAPMTITGDDLARIHGTGERLALADAGIAVAFYRRLIVRAGGKA